MARRGRTLWGLIDDLRSFTAAAGMLGWPIVLTPLVLLVWILGTDLYEHRAVNVFGLALLVVLLGYLLWVGGQLRAELPFHGALPMPVGASPQIESALSGAMLATGNGTRPELYFLMESTVNAAIWRADPEVRAIGVTTGMSQLLTRDELEAVFAHLLVRLHTPRDTITFRRDDLQRAADTEAARLLGGVTALYGALSKSVEYGNKMTGYGTLQASFFIPPNSVPADAVGRLEELREVSHGEVSA